MIVKNKLVTSLKVAALALSSTGILVGTNVFASCESSGIGMHISNSYGSSYISSVSTAGESARVDRIEAYLSADDHSLSLDTFNKLPKSRITKMREAYAEVVEAFKNGDEERGLQIRREKLKGYPLNIWLDYYYLAYNVSIDKFDAVMNFIRRNEHAEIANLLKARYSDFLSEEKDYVRLSILLGPKVTEKTDFKSMTYKEKVSMCRFYEANLPLQRTDAEALSFATQVYLDTGRRPSKCNGLLNMLDASGYISDTLVLKRFEKAYIQRQAEELTNSLAHALSFTDFKDRTVEQMKLYKEPEKLFEEIKDNTPVQHRVAVLAFKRYANLRPTYARDDLEKFYELFEPSDAEVVEISQIFASSFLRRSFSHDDVLWVDQHLPALAWTPELQEARLRRAVYFAEWDKIYVMVDLLPDYMRTATNWQYWKGRAAQELGRTDEAEAILAEVAKDRSFFGFYTAQTTKTEYPFNYRQISPDYSFPMDIAHNKAALRFFELHAMEDDMAIYEWREIARRSPEHEAMVMAQWALQSGMNNYAIDYVISANDWDALDYRFPIAYKDAYKEASRKTKVPLSFLYGISRQESMLNPRIRSSVGAMGLMQLMPGTAHDIAKKEHWKYQGKHSLLNPETNIQYGSTYLNWMLERFDNNRILAAAAYNAGPGRIPQWTSQDGIKRDVAMFVESIPFEETRKYVQNVLLYSSIYDFLLTGKQGELLNKNELSYLY